MPGSRTIKTLTALVVSLTIGAFALMMLETAPVEAPAQHLAAVEAGNTEAGKVVRRTAVPLQPIKWRNIILHGSAAERGDILDRVHFLVADDGAIQPTLLWQRQQSGHHAYVAGRDFNADSIGICLIGDYSRRGPERRQFEAVADLTTTLQRMFRIPADRVYLQSDLERGRPSPGPAFPAARFNEMLLR